MISKMSLLSALAVGVASLLTWGGLAFKDNHKYNSKMQEYENLRMKFFEKHKYLDSLLMCKNKSEKECEGGKGYLPNPKEYKDWEEIYKNFQNDKTKIPNINSFEDLKKYCYEEVRKDNDGGKEFYPGTSGPERHDLCVLNPYPAKIPKK